MPLVKPFLSWVQARTPEVTATAEALKSSLWSLAEEQSGTHTEICTAGLGVSQYEACA